MKSSVVRVFRPRNFRRSNKTQSSRSANRKHLLVKPGLDSSILKVEIQVSFVPPPAKNVYLEVALSNPLVISTL